MEKHIIYAKEMAVIFKYIIFLLAINLPSSKYQTTLYFSACHFLFGIANFEVITL